MILEEKIKNKLLSAEENRLEKLNSITERLKEHVNTIFFTFLKLNNDEMNVRHKTHFLSSKICHIFRFLHLQQPYLSIKN